MSYKQSLAIVLAIALGAGSGIPAAAQERAGIALTGDSPEAGFYGGIALRQNAQDTGGDSPGHLDSPWGKCVAPTAHETASRARFFRGYRWHHDLAAGPSFGGSP